VTPPGDASTDLVPPEIVAPLPLDSYAALDLYVGFGKGPWDVRAYVNNATGEDGWSSLSMLSSELTGANVQATAVPILPRTFGVELDVRF
jgi:outer membrane receptor protein involved in Fe transport